MRDGSAGAARELDEARRRASIERARPLRVPALRTLDVGGHACTGCGKCAEICPSRALELGVLGQADASAARLEVIRFDLDVGACIGCARCIDECPESALEGVPAPLALAPTFAGTARPVDLLALGEKAR